MREIIILTALSFSIFVSAMEMKTTAGEKLNNQNTTAGENLNNLQTTATTKTSIDTTSVKSIAKCDVEAMHVKIDGRWDTNKARDTFNFKFNTENCYKRQDLAWEGINISLGLIEDGCIADGDCPDLEYQASIIIKANGITSNVEGLVNQPFQMVSQKIKIGDKLFWIRCKGK